MTANKEIHSIGKEMNLERMSTDEKLNLSRKYFYIGFAFLPFVWLVNAVWFFKEAFIKKEPLKNLRFYVLGSIIGVIVWLLVFIAWTVVYQTQRSLWGAAGDYISFWVPTGVP